MLLAWRLKTWWDRATATRFNNLAGHFVDGLRKALYVSRRYTCYRDPAVFRGVYRVLPCVSTVIKLLVQLQLTSFANVSICSGFSPV